MKKKIISISAIAASFIPTLILAQTINNPLNGGNDIESIVKTLLNYILYIGGIISVFAFIYAGFLYVKARGNDTKLKEAHQFITGTVIGVAILLAAEVIGQIIKTTVATLRS